MHTHTNPTVTASIAWLPFPEGGRRTGPPESCYMAPARFHVPEDRWEVEAWNLVVTKDSAPAESEWLARVSFLVAEAPHEYLRTGNRFDLREGARVVARGVVL